MTLLLTELFFGEESASLVPVSLTCNHDIIIYTSKPYFSLRELKYFNIQSKFLKFSPCSLHFQYDFLDQICHAVKGASP